MSDDFQLSLKDVHEVSTRIMLTRHLNRHQLFKYDCNIVSKRLMLNEETAVSVYAIEGHNTRKGDHSPLLNDI